jgi:hypothetical protein
MLGIRRSMRDLLALLGMVAIVTAAPCAARAGWEAWNPVPFIEPLALSRGRLAPGMAGSATLAEADACRYVTEDWGWSHCDGIEAFVIDHAPGLEILLVYEPGRRGYVELDDWHAPYRSDAILAKEAELRETFADQALRIEKPIEFVRWRTYPTLNEERRYLYYATEVLWDGAPHLNVRAAVFDRRGYVVFDFVPADWDLGAAAIERLIEVSLDRYRSTVRESYGAFQQGDDIAPLGAVGVLASLVGVQPAATAIGGAQALVAGGMAKAWLALLLIPLVWLGRHFKR